MTGFNQFFFNEKVDIIVDGAPQERPVTKWS